MIWDSYLKIKTRDLAIVDDKKNYEKIYKKSTGAEATHGCDGSFPT